MIPVRLSSILLSSVLIVSCAQQKQLSSQRPETHWYKGNLHTHSFWSDGDEFPEVIMDWYKTRGYQFLALSDHNILAEGYRWIEFPDDTLYQNTFKRYLASYGEDWVKYKIDSGKVQVKLKTLEEYRGLFEEQEKFLIIKSEEITDRFEDKPIHMNATNIQKRIEPMGGNSVVEVLQNNINQVIKQRDETGVPMIPHVNHPNYGFGISLADMVALTGEHFFEVYNGHPHVHNLGDLYHISTEEMWDRINLSYLENGKHIMYGLATDDSHHYHVKGSEWSNAGRGWIMVQSEALNVESLINAMEAGRFYASTGVTLKEIKYDDIKKKLTVRVKPETGVTYTLSFLGYKKGKSDPEEFRSVVGTSASFKLTDDILFVRCKISSSKLTDNPTEEQPFEMAWTQPVMQK